jgi:hypothetical protein
MPVEIKELHIRIQIDEEKKGNANSTTPGDKEQWIAECVEQVVRILQQQNER